MIKKFDGYLIALILLGCISLIFYCGHYSGILIDFGREVYYPQQILNGKILYKDLFNIYGPLAYQINAILYKMLGAKLSTLYFAGSICSILTVCGIYLISKQFLSKFLSFCLGIFTITVGITVTSIFNLHFPYSWAILYGLVSFLYSLYFLLKYNSKQDEKYLLISSFLAGICIVCKYDFILYEFIILFFIAKSKNFKALIYNIFPTLLSFGILFVQGLKISYIMNSLSITKTMSQTKSLTFFYQNSGIYLHPKTIPTDFKLFLSFALPFCGILLGTNLFERKKLVSIIISLISSIVFFLYLINNIKVAFGFMPLFLLIFGISTYKKINFNTKILLISTLCASAKVFWVLLLQSYGNYYVSIILLSIFAILFNLIPKKLEKTTGIIVLTISCIIFFSNLNLRTKTNNKISTSKGTIYTKKDIALSTNKLINFIEKDTQKNDKIVVFPESMMINFLTERRSDDFYNSLLPLYEETFSEKTIVKHFQTSKPDYFILNNLDMKDYYFKFICQDYAFDFCHFVSTNYTLTKIIDNDFRYLIFKLK